MRPDSDLTTYMKKMYEMFEAGSPAAADSLVSSVGGVLGIGTDPEEWWTDGAVVAAFRTQVPEMHSAGMRLRSGEVAAYSEGSVGWVADRPVLHLPDGSAVPMRLTAVWHRDGDAWKMVQFHLSVGVPNQDAIGTELTI